MSRTPIRHCIAVALLLAGSLVQAQGRPDIVLGQLAPFTKLPVPQAPEINQGITAYMMQANKDGFLGRKLSLFKLDDEYNGDKFVEQFRNAMAKSPVALINPIGSVALKRMLDDKLLDTADVVVMNAIPGAESLRDPGHPKFFHLRAGDKQQIEKIVSNAKAIGITRLSVLNNDQEVGLSGAKVALQEGNRIGGLQVRTVTAVAGAPGLAKASAEVVAQDPQGVVIIGVPNFVGDGLAALRKAGLSQPVFVLSAVQPELLIKVAGPEGARGVGIAQTFPNPNNSTLPVTRDFRAAMKQAYPDVTRYTPFQLEGYLSARTLGEALKRIKDKDVSGAALQRSLKTMGELDFGGFRVDFTASNVGSRFVDIAVIDREGKLRY
jgi:ABC-type branched-subunit amino acid transport system substrate-binding protein